MPLAVGLRLGSYEIVGAIGAGGMGEVYRARDTKLGRDVALKVLPEAFANDPDRLARFQREAQLLASLNHPNIAAIYGLEEDPAKAGSHVSALVLELVDGPTLADHIAQGAIPIDEALPIARQIAEALEAAHEKGIVHRDLKPANVKLTPDGTVKVLDFGLAKMLETEPAARSLSMSPTLSVHATYAGVILGTAAYMSPEQAKGGVPLDRRSDIFSFGCVLYEMLAGSLAFPGETVTEMLASVIARDADFARLPANLNPRLYELLRRCLERDPKRRWQSAGDLRLEIEAVSREPRAVASVPMGRPTRGLTWKVAALAVACAVAGAAIGGVAIGALRPGAVHKTARFTFVLPDDQNFTRTGRPVLAISPDGANIVYVANNQLYLRKMGELESRPVPGTNQDVNTPFFSPDGQWIGFYSFRDATLKKIAISGGATVTLAAMDNPFGAAWSDDLIVVGQGGKGILGVPAAGGQPEVVVKAEPGEVTSSPQMLPDEKTIIFSVTKATGKDRWDKADIVSYSRETQKRTVLIHGGSDGRYVPAIGRIIYALGPSMLGVPFDPGRLKVTGGPASILEGVARTVIPENTTPAAQLATGREGTLAYIPSASGDITQWSVAAIDRRGKTESLNLPPATYAIPRLSPDGKRLAIESDGDVWIFDLAGKIAPSRLTFDGSSSRVVWSPDGRYVAFDSVQDGRRGVFRLLADGNGAMERLTTVDAGETQLPTSFASRATGQRRLGLVRRAYASIASQVNAQATVPITCVPADARWNRL